MPESRSSVTTVEEEEEKPKMVETVSEAAPPPEIEEEEEAPKKGAPMWIVTFADLSTLMLTFFILMLSFANMDIVKFKEMLGSVQDAFGVQKQERGQYQSVLRGREVEKISKAPGYGASDADAKKEKEDMAATIESAIGSSGLSSSASVSSGKKGVKVRIKGSYLFKSGQATIKDASKLLLDAFALVMEEYPFNLKIEGHTDDRPISTKMFPSNWELSAVRATTVLRYLANDAGVEKKRLLAIGYADTRPLATNEEEWGRAKNRRVEFVFTKEK